MCTGERPAHDPVELGERAPGTSSNAHGVPAGNACRFNRLGKRSGGDDRPTGCRWETYPPAVSLKDCSARGNRVAAGRQSARPYATVCTGSRKRWIENAVGEDLAAFHQPMLVGALLLLDTATMAEPIMVTFGDIGMVGGMPTASVPAGD